MSTQLSELAKRELAWRRCRKDILWASTHWWIQHPLGSRQWELYPAQREILSAWAGGDNWLHLKARQLGFSTSVGFFAWWVAFFNPDSKILLLSRGERESMELLDKVVFGLDRLPIWLRERGPKVTSRTLTKVSFDNGSEIVSLPSASDPARGFTGRLVVVDEWAFLPDSERAWAAIEPVADIGGQIIGLSTANGVNNFFYTLWQRARSRKSTFKWMFFGWDAVPGRDDDWYERKSMDLLPWQLHQEYPSDPEEAFIRSGATVFDINSLKKRETTDGERFRIEGVRTRSPRLSASEGGEVEVWHKPTPDGVYVMGVDVAEGLGHGDYSSAHVMDVATRGVVATWHGHLPADLFGEQVEALGRIYNMALIGPEANNHGLTTITILRQLGYPKIFRRRQINKVNNKVSIEFGYKTTRTTKAPLIDRLGAWLREDKPLPCPRTVTELMTYVRDERGSMSGSPHDDRVISLALAVYMLEFAHLPEYKTERDDRWTMDWWGRQTHEDDMPQAVGIRPLGR